MIVQWYPGHMTKAKRQMQEDIKLIDLIIELVDARIPLSSRNPDIDELGKNKSRLVLLNKADLADEKWNEKWTQYFQEKGFYVLKVNSKSGAGLKSIQGIIQEACKEKIERDRRRGIKNRPVRAMVVGIPNVGKSSLFNRLAKQRIAITSDVSGTTRDTNKTEIQIDDKNCILIDSGGIDESNELFINVKNNTLNAAKCADIIIFMVDGKMLPDDADKKLFYSLLKLNKPIALVINKVDSKKDEERSWEFNEFGASVVFNISVSHASGVDELCEWIYKQLPQANLKSDTDDFDEFLEDFNEQGELDLDNKAIDYENKNISFAIYRGIFKRNWKKSKRK